MAINDGIHGMLPRNEMEAGIRKLRDIYEGKPDAEIYHKEFGFYSLEKWLSEGKLDGKPHDAWTPDTYMRDLFGFDQKGNHNLDGLGWCEAAFFPTFEEKLLEDRGEHELIQDTAGRGVLYFKGRKNGYMPEYLTHPVKDVKSWEKNCKWRLQPTTEGRFEDLEIKMAEAVMNAKKGMMITQRLVGGYMYLRSLMGPIELLYLFYDEPQLIHDCMETWFLLADAIVARHQKYVTLDELFISEDICYNCGPFISPAMMKNFLFPYYQQLIINIKARQLDKTRHLYFQVDTDGYAPSVIEYYKELGMDVMSPFEVASGCDVVEIGRLHPELILSGGIDKRILAEGKTAIDKHLDHIIPVMKKRGGYIPTCDHGVPEEVSFENYMHYRNKLKEYNK